MSMRIMIAPVVLALVLMAAPAANAAQRTSFSAKGGVATAQFIQRIDECIVAYMTVQAYDEIVRDGTGPREKGGHAFVQAIIADGCGTETIMYLGDEATRPGEFVRSKADSATLRKTMAICAGSSCANVDVDIEWTGTGGLTRTNYVSHADLPGMRIVQRGDSRNRENIDVAGSIDFLGREWVTGEKYAYLGTSGQSWITITK